MIGKPRMKQLLDVQFDNEKIIHNHQLVSEKNDKAIRYLFGRSNYKKRIRVNFRELVNIVNNDYTTHRIHKYPAKLFPHIPQLFIKNSILSSYGDLVCDPFCGSGTVPLESILHNRNAIGIELNPVPRLIAKVKVTPIEPTLLLHFFEVLRNSFNRIGRINPPDFQNIDYWFSKKIKQDLTIILHSINNSISNEDIRNFFLVCFSATIRRVSKADPKINQPVYSKHMRISYDHRKINTFRTFTEQVYSNIKRMSELFYLHNKDVKASIIEGDSRNVRLKKNIQLVITSPPYLSAQEYFRSTRLEFNWLGMNKEFDIRLLMSKSVGLEGIKNIKNPEINESGIRKLDLVIKKISEKSKTKAYLTSRYFDDLIQVMSRMEYTLNHDGYFVLVIGNNEICGIKVPSNEIIADAAKSCGLELKLELVDEIKSRGLMTRRNITSGIIDRESVLIMKKQ